MQFHIKVVVITIMVKRAPPKLHESCVRHRRATYATSYREGFFLPSLYFQATSSLWALAAGAISEKHVLKTLILSDKRWLRLDGYGFEGPTL